MRRDVLLRGESDPGSLKGKSAYLMRMSIILSTETIIMKLLSKTFLVDDGCSLLLEL